MSAHDDQADKKHAEAARTLGGLFEGMRGSWPMHLWVAHLDSLAHRAREVRAKYQALIGAGFTEEQALKTVRDDAKM